jgi:4-azaleucine resistance transporter AzlC
MIGALMGAVIPFSVEGIDFALTALFITIFVEQWLNNKDHAPAIIGVVISAVCVGIFGTEHFLIPAMFLIMLAITLLRKREECSHE